jgi:hypothetical protein
MNADGRGVPVVAGPLAGYEAAFRAHLSRSGYTPLSARDLMRAMARVSRWLEDRGLTASGLTPPLTADLAAGVAGGARCCGSCARPARFPRPAARLMPRRRRR